MKYGNVLRDTMQRLPKMRIYYEKLEEEKAYDNRDENGAMGNGCEAVGKPEKLGDLGGSKDGIDSDGHEKAGMVPAR